MGLLDSLLGRTKPVSANLDALFSLPSAALTLQSSAGLVSSSQAGVSWKSPPGQASALLQKEIEELLDLDEENNPKVSGLSLKEDSFGYRWLMVQDPELEELVTRVHMINSTLADAGWGPQLLCSVFGFIPGDDAASDTSAFSLIYLFKRGTFYPFAPSGDEKRNTEFELRIRSMLENDLPIESDLARWFPLWDLPVH